VLTVCQDGPITKLVPQVSSITFSGPRSLERGQSVRNLH
jgi:acyl CoA:acetate/3-ketoacid CoA transferase